MSTIKEIIERIDENKPNAFGESMKLRWIAQLDGKIAADLFLMDIAEIRALQYTVDSQPLVEYPHDDIYDLWLSAKIDFENGEYNKYQNTMLMYNEAYGNFASWFLSVYAPARGCAGDRFQKRCDVPSYYITAYGLAIKQGFRGTLEEWLQSLVGADGARVELLYEGNIVKWRYENEEAWQDLLDMADIQGDVIAQTLKAATEAADTAQNARSAIEGMSVSAQTLQPGSLATVEKAVVDGAVQLSFGIPQGMAGPQGAVGPQGAQGIQGPPGPQGVAGVAVQTSGYVTFTVSEDGHLLCSYPGDEAPGYYVDDAGHLILEY